LLQAESMLSHRPEQTQIDEVTVLTDELHDQRSAGEHALNYGRGLLYGLGRLDLADSLDRAADLPGQVVLGQVEHAATRANPAAKGSVEIDQPLPSHAERPSKSLCDYGSEHLLPLRLLGHIERICPSSAAGRTERRICPLRARQIAVSHNYWSTLARQKQRRRLPDAGCGPSHEGNRTSHAPAGGWRWWWSHRHSFRLAICS
jgi:hypothetical protein